MSDNNNKFEIEKYIKDNLEKEELKNKVIINLTEDDNHDPYIEITYITEDSVEAGLVKNYNNLKRVKEFAIQYNDLLEQFFNDSIVPVVYDPQTENLNLIKRKDNSYVGHNFKFNQPNAFFVGYICNDKCYSEKIDLFCELIANIMLSQTRKNFGDLVFRVKNKEIPHVKYIKYWTTGYEEIEIPQERGKIRERNQEMIRTEFQLIKK